MRRTMLMLFLLLSVVSVFAQDFKKDMTELNKAYSTNGCLTIGIRIRMYQEKKASPVTTQEATIQKKDNRFFYTMGTTKMLLAEKALLMIHESEKDIVFQEVKSGEYEKYVKQMLSLNMDSVATAYDSVMYVGMSAENKHYIVYSTDKMIQTTDVYIHGESSFLTKLVYHYNKGITNDFSRVEITFSNSRGSIAEDVFSLNKYITKSGKDYKLKPAYSGYHLIITKNEE